MKKIICLLLVAMLSCSMLFAGCESKSEQNTESRAVDVESVKDLDAIKDSGIVKFIPMADNGLGFRPLLTDEEIKAQTAWIDEYRKKGLFIDIGPEVVLYSYEEYLDYIAKNQLFENFIGPENFAPVEYLDCFVKHYVMNSYGYSFKIDGKYISVNVYHNNDNVANLGNEAVKVSSANAGNVLRRESSKDKDYEKVQIGENIEGVYSKGYLTDLTIYTEYAKIEISVPYTQEDYVGYGPVLGRILKDGAQAKFGRVMSSLNSWASNFTDVKKIDAAVADANRYAKKDSAVK